MHYSATLLLFVILFFTSCNTHSKEPLIAKDTINTYEKNNTLLAFVGEKIEIKDTVHYDLAIGITAKYKILQRVYGDYAGDTIEFEAFDHYDVPAFTKYKNVLMFVSRDSGKYYQERYQYFDVYKTKNGKWAGAYAGEDYKHPYNGNLDILPEKIDFESEVSYPLTVKNSHGKEIAISYPQPYYSISGNKAIAVYGNYVEDLFRLKKGGYLSWLFNGNDMKYRPIMGLKPLLYHINSDGTVSQPPAAQFKSFWKNFSKCVKEQNCDSFAEMLFDSFWVSNKIITKEKFSTCFSRFFNPEIAGAISDSLANNSEADEIDSLNILPKVWKEIIPDNGYYIYRHLTIEIKPKEKESYWVSMEFILTKSGYKLYSCYNSKDWRCCR